jgi:hypothetical protein
MTREWGPPTWMLFHAIAHRIDPDFYKQQAPFLLDLFKSVCATLPCPICVEHATKYMSTITIRQLPTKEKFEEMLWTFHNTANKRLKKDIYPADQLERYSKARIFAMLQLYKRHMYNNYHLNRGFTDQMMRKRVADKVSNFLISNKDKF